MNSLREIVLACADVALSRQSESGYMPAGHNGPWNTSETPVRNTGHWLITFLKAHQWTDESKYHDAALEAVEFLLSDQARPHGQTFHHLIGTTASRPNGLVGQAWSIEALATAGDVLDRPDLLDLAAKVFLLHLFDETVGAWRVVDIDGRSLGFDLTFNHQLWFAAAGGLLAHHSRVPDEVHQQVLRFLDELESNITVTNEGVIEHPFKPRLHPVKYTKICFDIARTGQLRKIARGALESEVSDGMVDKAIGYQSFNLYGLALLAEQFPKHSIWDSSSVGRSIAFVNTTQFRDRLDDNPYGYPYNVSGFELAYVEEILGEGNTQRQTAWIERQLERTYDESVPTVGAHTEDTSTVGARLYEATRIADISVST